MNKKYIIKKNEEIEVIVKKGKKRVSKYFIIYMVNNDKDYNMYCVSVSKKLGKANVRNKIKRRTKDILMKNKIDLGKVCYNNKERSTKCFIQRIRRKSNQRN